MNSYRYPRRRARRNSVNFKVLGWILMREATLALLWPNYESWGTTAQARHWLSEMRTDHLLELARRTAQQHPERLHRP